MGYGSYSASDWKKLKDSRKLDRGQSVEESLQEIVVIRNMIPDISVQESALILKIIQTRHLL